MRQPYITVIVCTKNEEQYLYDCLKCLAEQIIRPEIIVVDAHSKDKTVQIAKIFADKILYDDGTGVAEARNMGAKTASASVVAYCDADCRPKKDWTLNVLKFIQGNIMVSGPLKAYDGSLKLRADFLLWANWLPTALSYFDYHNVWGPNMAFQKSFLLKHKFKANLLEDYEIGMRLKKIGPVKFSPHLVMPTSTRRYERSFYRTAIKYYITTAIEMNLRKGRRRNNKHREKSYWKHK